MISTRTLLAVFAGSGAVLSTALFALHARAPGGEPIAIQGFLEPVTMEAGSRLGGSVAEVCVFAEQHVRKGEVLVRFDTSQLTIRLQRSSAALRVLKRAFDGMEIMQRIPDSLRGYMVESHAGVVSADASYAKALAEFEAAPDAEREAAKSRLALAAEARMRVRSKTGAMFESLRFKEEIPNVAEDLRRSIAQIEEAVKDGTVTSPADAVVDILDVKPGDRILPGRPVALLLLRGEYFADLVLPAEQFARLQPGMVSKGILKEESRSFEWRVESLSKRNVPVAFREDRRVGEEFLIRARVRSSKALRPGSSAMFELP
jgi:multidrug resistance efflux pump